MKRHIESWAEVAATAVAVIPTMLVALVLLAWDWARWARR